MLAHYLSKYRAIARSATAAQLFMSGRAIIAIGQLSMLVTTPMVFLTVPVGGVEQRDLCESYWSSWNMLCASTVSLEVTRWIYIAALVWVLSGLYPRVSGLAHYYVSLSLLSGITLPDGGEAAAVVALTWIAIVCLGDHRTFAWSAEPYWRPANGSARKWWHAVPIVAGAFLKIQCSIIYFHSATSKLSTESWLDGTALYYILRMDMFGVAGPLSEFALTLTSIPAIALILAHGTLAVELSIAVLIWVPGRWPLLALGASIGLHTAIVVLLGISSFALVMIGVVATAISVVPMLSRGAKSLSILMSPAEPARVEEGDLTSRRPEVL